MDDGANPIPDKELEARLRRLEALIGVDRDRDFNRLAFEIVLRRYGLRFIVLLALVALPMSFVQFAGSGASEATVLGAPLVGLNTNAGPLGLTTGIIAMGPAALGVVAVGGLALGVLSFGGGSIGVLSLGGGSIGLIAIGGGAVGLIALGGGAMGYVAFGGGAYGVYVLAGDGAGSHVLSRQRQDPTAIAFFCRFLPQLRRAFGNPST